MIDQDKDDLWLNGLLLLAAFFVSFFLHAVTVGISAPTEKTPPVVLQMQILTPSALQEEKSIDQKQALLEQESSVLNAAYPIKKLRNKLPTATQPEPALTAQKTTGWKARFAPTRKSLYERNRIAEKRMKARETLLANVAGKALWPKISPQKIAQSKVAQCYPQKTLTLDVKTRSVKHWAPFFPGALFPADYAEGLQQILSTKHKRFGQVQPMALPKQILEIPLDEPYNAVLLIGRNDIHCALIVRFSLGKTAPFPLSLLQVPMRIVLPSAQTSVHAVDLEFYENGQFILKKSKGATQADLPFAKGRIAKSRQLSAAFNGWKSMLEFSIQALR